MTGLPTGTVTFLFTDVEGSTGLWERHPEAMREALARHDDIVERLAAHHGGQVVRPRGEGDSRFCVFADAGDAVAAGAALQRSFHEEPWPLTDGLRIRIALHTGEADLRAGDYYGSAVNRCARLRSLAAGGQILLSAATTALARARLPAGATLLDLGEHRLRDLRQPERVHQLLIEGVPPGVPPIAPTELVPGNLPTIETSFVGRERDLAAVSAAIAAHRLVTLVGPGGTGKTRLALEAAAGSLARDAATALGCPDGIWLVELAGVVDPDLVPGAVLSVMGLREERDLPPTAALVRGLRDKSVLLLLDNCEHVIGAAAELVDTLLRACRGLRILATSREALGLPGEAVSRVPPLLSPSVGAGQALNAETIARYDAVRLFVERVRLLDPTFAVTDRNAAAVAAVCSRLDGIPLAIELAAARAHLLTVEQIAARLNDRFRLLAGTKRSGMPRQRTLRALIAWSYDLLAGDDQRNFRWLSVCTGAFTLETAEAICEGTDALEGVSRLLDRSMLVAEDGVDGRQYRILESLREYGRDRQTEAGERDAPRDRHAHFYASLASRGRAGLRGASPALWIARLAEAYDNCRAALEWLIGQPERGELRDRLAADLQEYWWARGLWSEGRTWLDRVLTVDAPRGPARAAVLNGAARLARWQADLVRAEKLFGEALGIAISIASDDQAAQARLGLGEIHRIAATIPGRAASSRRHLPCRGGRGIGTRRRMRWRCWAGSPTGNTTTKPLAATPRRVSRSPPKPAT